ncbi:STN domain-containing protein [Achromobacter sp.]|uniref:STN domain-containing protein n=1 Tax=Achromobacter sp. TaxID=134375 RepID=UPI0028A7286F|nr:STN domain-containing protein [Achromobacter sp.]
MVATLAVGAAVAASLPVNAAPQAATPEYVFDWPRQPLHDALQQYGELTGDSVLYDTGQAAGKTAPALTGRYTAREALTRLLAGTDLQAHYTAPRALMLMPRLRTPAAPPPPPASRADRQQYYGRLQSRVLAALCARPALRTGDYRVALRVSLDPAHALSDVKVHATGHPDMEPAIRDALSGVPIGAPPEGFGLPATLLITPEAARRYGGCAP